MIRNKFATVGLSLALGLSMVAPVSAVTVAELQAQINALMAQLSALQGGSSASTGTQITSDLTVGSTGAQVSALQSSLVSQGHLVMPAGVAMGYFGSLTKAAVQKWQAANGVPPTGYFGPMSRAKYNTSAGTGSTSTTVGSTASITTPGVEGTITVTKNPSPASGTKVYEGSSKVAVLGIKLEAKGSDMKIERIKLDLDETGNTATVDSQFYTKFAQKVYIMDGSTVLASADLSSSTVVEESNEISITLAGMSLIVPKDSTKVLTVALDARSSWDSTYDTDTWTVGVPAEGVRAVDGVGVNQYGPATGNAFSNSVSSEGDLAESATLTVSTDSDTPKDMEKVCTLSSTEDECDGLELLRFNIRAEKDSVKVTDLDVRLSKTDSTGGGATTTTGYLYDGGTLVGSATLLNQSGSKAATFSNIDYVVPKDTTKTLTFKIDVKDTTIAASTYTASTTASDFTSENSAGTSATVSGNGVGESITVRKIGPEFTLVSAGTPAYTAAQGFAGATSSAKVDFVIRMKAVGGDIVFGDSASTTYPLIVLGTSNGATASSSVLYRGGAAVSGGTHAATAEYVASSTSITVPSGLTATTSNSWTLSEGNTVDIPVSMVFNGRFTDSLGNTGAITTGAWAVQINRLQWATPSDVGERHISDFMSGNSTWRSGTVTMP